MEIIGNDTTKSHLQATGNDTCKDNYACLLYTEVYDRLDHWIIDKK